MGLGDLYPDRMTDSVYGLDWEKLTGRYRGVIFDIDNTLVPHGAPADEKAIRLFDRIHGLGLRTMLVSNNGEERVKPFADQVRSGYVYDAGKPGARGYLEAMKKMGISCSIVDPDDDYDTLCAAFQDNTKCVLAETIANPALVVLDIEKFAKAAHAHQVPLIVDNTFATPINCNPFQWGADIVTHSTTKYMDGHAMCVGGAIVDSGNFDWSLYPEKFPGLCTPDESYHGIIYTEKFGKKAYITKATSQLMRDLGSIQSPMNAFLLNIGLETLHLRMPRHCENALKVAQYLENHEKVAWVNYPGLKSSKYYELAQKYMPNGTCGVISFGLKGGRSAAEGLMDKLELAAIVTHVADARTCVLHPASHTHRQMNDEQLKEAGVNPDLIRFSVGLENADDIIADLEQALAQI